MHSGKAERRLKSSVPAAARPPHHAGLVTRKLNSFGVFRLALAPPPHGAKHPNMRTWNNLRVATLLAFLFGSLFVSLVFSSIAPGAVMLSVAAPAWLLLALLYATEPATRWGYSFLVAFYWLVYGLVVLLEGPTVPTIEGAADADRFYGFIYFDRVPETLEETRWLTEGSLAVKVWNTVYNFVESFGVLIGPYIGIAVNIAMMAAAGAIALDMTQRLYGNDLRRAWLVVLLFASSGLFLLFTSLHVRDSFATLLVTVLAAIWVAYLQRRRMSWLLIAALATPVFSVLLYHIRDEFSVLPFAFIAAAVGARFVSTETRGGERLWVSLLAAIGWGALIVGAGGITGTVGEKLIHGHESYEGQYDATAAGNSLGASLVLKQPISVRFVLGPPYVLFMPIPVWHGFVSGNFYHIAKSVSAVYFYFLAPALAATAWLLWRRPKLRTVPVIFLSGSFASLLVMIGITSLESRHLGAFLPLAIVASVAFEDLPAFRSLYRRLLFGLLSSMAILHLAWLFLKAF